MKKGEQKRSRGLPRREKKYKKIRKLKKMNNTSTSTKEMMLKFGKIRQRAYVNHLEMMITITANIYFKKNKTKYIL